MSEFKQLVRASIIKEVLASPLIGDECEIFYLERDDDVRRYQAVASTNFDPSISLVFSLPTDTTNIFITASDGESSLIRRVIANLEDINTESEILLGNVQIFQSVELQRYDIGGVLLLPIETSNLLKFLPETFLIGQSNYKFLLVVFISNQEHKLWQEKGHDALMDYFSEIGKDLMSF